MGERKAYLRRARHWIASRGWRSFFTVASQRLWYKLLRKPVPGQVRPERGPHPFDLRHGVDTTGLIFGETLFDHRGRSEHSQEAHFWVTGYYGVAPSAFQAAMERVGLRWQEFTFVDIGCGKGRALLLAAHFPFREVMGVELAPQLADTARLNLSLLRNHAALHCHVITGDATRFRFPAGPLLLFLYHPFGGPVMRQFLQHVTAALQEAPREVYLLYCNPEHAPEILATPGFTQVWRESFPFSAEDVDADRFGSTYEQFALFQAVAAASPEPAARTG